MIDVVYTLGIESNWDDSEVKYSLRSLQNLDQLGKVYVIGHRPHWMNPYEVIHIPCPDVYKTNKDANLIAKLLLACYQKDLSQKFLWFSDDQVLLNKIPIEIFDYPTTDNSHLIFDMRSRLNRWQTRLKRTSEVLKERGYKADCYEAHIPYLYDKDLYPQTILQYDYGYDVGYCSNTLYFNTTRAEGKDNVQEVLAKLATQSYTIEFLEIITQNKLFLNYTESAITSVLFEFLKQKFPNKSKFEI
jgi:hypothetical protein